MERVTQSMAEADQCTEPQNPWQNATELNGVKYLKSHAQVLLDSTGAPDFMWLLAQDNLEHVHYFSANSQINWNIAQQVSWGPGGTPDIPCFLMFYLFYSFEPVLYLDQVSRKYQNTWIVCRFCG
jgi:hypothetical protein